MKQLYISIDRVDLVAPQAGDVEGVREQLQLGVPAELPGKDGKTALEMAVCLNGLYVYFTKFDHKNSTVI